MLKNLVSVDCVVDLLKTGVFAVTFTKADGEVRTIVGTLPADAHAKNDICVPIVESATGLWKSFRFDSLANIVPV